MNKIPTYLQLFHFSRKVEDSDIVHFFEEETKLKVSSEIKATLVLSISVNAELKHTRFAHLFGGKNEKMRIKLL